ncbi:hypothetical protein ACFLSW_03075 [Candidatus Bipolaricaulota bacterium]
MCGALLLLWTMSLLLYAAPQDRFAEETGLDPDLVNYVTVNIGGTELTIFFVFINERTFQSKISLELSLVLQPYVGLNALYVNPGVDAVVNSFAFSPESVSFRQGGVNLAPPWEAWDEITPGFLSGGFEINPSGPEHGSGSEGVVILGDLIDSQLPFDVLYAGESASFDIGSTPIVTQNAPGAPAAAAQSHDPIEVAPLDTLDALQDLLLHEDFSSQAMAALFELDPALVRTMVLNPRGGDELRMFFVRLEESVHTSLLGGELLATIEELIGTGAVMVWAVSPTGAEFSPWHFYIKQNDTNYVFFSTASFVELTEDFLRVERVNPGDIAAGVIRLPRSVEALSPFSVFYGTSGVDYP